jgi:hypothetical protein
MKTERVGADVRRGRNLAKKTTRYLVAYKEGKVREF